jgi:hypothetical protein
VKKSKMRGKKDFAKFYREDTVATNKAQHQKLRETMQRVRTEAQIGRTGERYELVPFHEETIYYTRPFHEGPRVYDTQLFTGIITARKCRCPEQIARFNACTSYIDSRGKCAYCQHQQECHK